VELNAMSNRTLAKSIGTAVLLAVGVALLLACVWAWRHNLHVEFPTS
jgi:hypothetical protein